MTALVTGGAGFIGSHLSETLVARGERVIILDDLSTGSVTNVRHLRTNPLVHCYFESMMERTLLCELVDEADVVYHLAAAVGVRRIIESPVRTIETNVKGTELVLECASKKKKTVFIASTSEVYGKNVHAAFREDDDIVLGPSSRSRWSYATSKLLDEFLALAYWKEKNVPVVIGRLFNTVGPRQTGRYGMVLPTFVRQALEGTPITVYGNGQQTRCFGYVGDVVESIVRLVSCPAAVGHVVNIGSDKEISITALAELIKARAQSASPIQFLSYDEAYAPGFEDMLRRVPCVEKLMSLICFRPTTGLTVIVDEVIEYVRGEKRKATPAHPLNLSVA
ncbi:MAG: GDP-mannose 4,6-dehydratase [Acidobacteriia bacterium]|nr:GDP-mannose 4,6-dehydratase [Terriglobia bacterium]